MQSAGNMKTKLESRTETPLAVLVTNLSLVIDQLEGGSLGPPGLPFGYTYDVYIVLLL